VWVAIAGLALSAYGQYASGRAKAEEARRQAEIGRAKAIEIMRRNDVNNQLLLQTTGELQETRLTQQAGSGAVQDASYFSRMEDIYNRAASQAKRNTDAAKWEASMAIAGADSDMRSARDYENAGAISALGTAGLGGAELYKSYGGGLSTKKEE